MVTTRSQWIKETSGRGEQSQTQTTQYAARDRDQPSSGSRGGRKGRAPKRVVDEDDDETMNLSTYKSRGGRKGRAPKRFVDEDDETMNDRDQPSSGSRGGRKGRAPKRVVDEDDETMNVRDQPSSGSRGGRKGRAPKRFVDEDDETMNLSTYKSAPSFFSENVEGWKYSGRPVSADLSDSVERIRYKNQLWCELKALSRKMIDLQVEFESVDPYDPVKRLKFKVSSFASKLNRAGSGVAVNHFATIHVTAQQNADTYFVFTLDNRDLAEDCEVSVKTLRNACERVFQTVVLRCENKDGYNKYEDPAYLDMLFAVDNALEMPVSSPESAEESNVTMTAEAEEESREPIPEPEKEHSEASGSQSEEHSDESEESESQQEEEESDVKSTFGLV